VQEVANKLFYKKQQDGGNFKTNSRRIKLWKESSKTNIYSLLVITSIIPGPRALKLPDYTRFKLANGLTIYLMEQH
jgi:hypothetical protein